MKKNAEGLDKVEIPLCREPWESFYILRRGIIPCCFGNPIETSWTKWEDAWNSQELQEIRSYLSRGKLSPYCLKTLSCPIVQRHLRNERGQKYGLFYSPQERHPLLRLINRMFFRIPGKIYRFLSSLRRVRLLS